MILTVTIHPALDKIVRVPRLRPNDVARARIEMQYGGGKGNNVARALSRLGVPVIATGFQGGHSGKFVTSQLENEGIHTDFVICRAPTRTSLLIIEEETGNTYAIYEPGQRVESDEINRFRKHFFNLLKRAHMVLFCGSAQSPELAAIYFELIQAAEKRGVHCGLDSSGTALREGLKAKPYIVKINLGELSEVVGQPLSDLDVQVKALLELCRSGISLAALSRGREGLLVTDGTTCLEGVLVMDNVVNFMGCGDSLLAGMVSAILEGASLEAMVRRGVACGAANTQVVGAGFIDPVLVQQLESKVTIRLIF